jgi:predicted RNase H-like HicB family nuclease
VKKNLARTIYNLVIRPEQEGGYTVTVPSLPGCVTFGKTLIEAKRMARDAIKLYIASLVAHREKIPTDTDTYISPLEVSYA